jgi:hypothetical protein
VSDVIKLVWQRHAKRSDKPPSGGEAWPEKHGYFDGRWWRGMSNDPLHIGFVEGEIACFETEADSTRTFGESATHYIQLLNEWYQHEDREATKVPDVLIRLGRRRPARR